MPASTTFLVFATQMGAEVGIAPSDIPSRFIYKFSAATVTNTTVTTTDPGLLKLGAAYVETLLRGHHIYLETAAESRMVDTISISGSTVTINFTGGNATNQASATNAYLLRSCSWGEFRDLVNDQLEYIPVETMIPLAHGPDDYDLQDSDSVDNSWTESNATDTVQTTAAEVLWGARSLVVANSSANGYTQSTTMRVGQGKRIYAGAVAKADTGRGEFAIFDNSSNEEAAVNFTEEDWLFIWKQVTLGSADEGAFLRLRGDGASDSIDWNFAWMVKDGIRQFDLPSWVDEHFKVKAILRATFHEAGAASDTWLAQSVEFERLDDDEWYPEIHPADANSYRIRLEPWVDLSTPMFLLLEAAYSNVYGVAATFSTDASTTPCPPHLLTAAVKKAIGLRFKEHYPDAAAIGHDEYEKRLKNRRTLPPKKRRYKVRNMFRR